MDFQVELYGDFQVELYVDRLTWIFRVELNMNFLAKPRLDF